CKASALPAELTFRLIPLISPADECDYTGQEHICQALFLGFFKKSFCPYRTEKRGPSLADPPFWRWFRTGPKNGIPCCFRIDFPPLPC
ncbi:MAG: hypothetical protein IJK69_06740, partial [Oscillospiraceae bacterium]|nr:hypothetical protein [Oscillospiraceae bacterium]